MSSSMTNLPPISTRLIYEGITLLISNASSSATKLKNWALPRLIRLLKLSRMMKTLSSTKIKRCFVGRTWLNCLSSWARRNQNSKRKKANQPTPTTKWKRKKDHNLVLSLPWALTKRKQCLLDISKSHCWKIITHSLPMWDSTRMKETLQFKKSFAFLNLWINCKKKAWRWEKLF